MIRFLKPCSTDGDQIQVFTLNNVRTDIVNSLVLNESVDIRESV